MYVYYIGWRSGIPGQFVTQSNLFVCLSVRLSACVVPWRSWWPSVRRVGSPRQPQEDVGITSESCQDPTSNPQRCSRASHGRLQREIARRRSALLRRALHWSVSYQLIQDKKLSCRRETARCFVSLNILISCSRSVNVIRNYAVE